MSGVPRITVGPTQLPSAKASTVGLRPSKRISAPSSTAVWMRPSIRSFAAGEMTGPLHGVNDWLRGTDAQKDWTHTSVEGSKPLPTFNFAARSTSSGTQLDDSPTVITIRPPFSGDSREPNSAYLRLTSRKRHAPLTGGSGKCTHYPIQGVVSVGVR